MSRRKHRHSGRNKGWASNVWDFDPIFATPRSRDQVWPNLWIGNQWAAKDLHGKKAWRVVDVREGPLPKDDGANVVHAPILLDDTLPAYASMTRLERACAQIDQGLADGKKVIVHCWQGMERSPLTVVWWLHTRQGMSLRQVLAHVQLSRPVWDRLSWLVPLDQRPQPPLMGFGGLAS